MIAATNIHYEIAQRAQGLAPGGIGAMLLLARTTGLVRDIDRDLHLLKRHLPYHESDHVLNIALNLLAGGRCLEHIELRRNDEAFLDALGARRIPDPTTAGDFCRRFAEDDVLTLMETFNGARRRVWAQQPPEFFDRAILDADGTLVATDARCKGGATSPRSEEHTSELQSHVNLVCRLLLEKKKDVDTIQITNASKTAVTAF